LTCRSSTSPTANPSSAKRKLDAPGGCAATPPRFVTAHALQSRVASIAERSIFRVFAPAPGDCPGVRDLHLLWRKSAALVRAVAKRLFLRSPARTPPIRARFDWLYDGGFVKNDWLVHNLNGLLEPWSNAVVEERQRQNYGPRLARSCHPDFFGAVLPLVRIYSTAQFCIISVRLSECSTRVRRFYNGTFAIRGRTNP
jgi:hypothetical protein